MIPRSDVDRILVANRYLVIATADACGQPWATPVFFARLDPSRLCWVSSPDSRHSRNIHQRSEVSITVFDSTVDVGRGEAAYFEAYAAPAPADDSEAALQALNARLPETMGLTTAYLQPEGAAVVYVAEVRHRYLLVRGGDTKFGNKLDMTVEV